MVDWTNYPYWLQNIFIVAVHLIEKVQLQVYAAKWQYKSCNEIYLAYLLWIRPKELILENFFSTVISLSVCQWQWQQLGSSALLSRQTLDTLYRPRLGQVFNSTSDHLYFMRLPWSSTQTRPNFKLKTQPKILFSSLLLDIGQPQEWANGSYYDSIQWNGTF